MQKIMKIVNPYEIFFSKYEPIYHRALTSSSRTTRKDCFFDLTTITKETILKKARDIIVILYKEPKVYSGPINSIRKLMDFLINSESLLMTESKIINFKKLANFDPEFKRIVLDTWIEVNSWYGIQPDLNFYQKGFNEFARVTGIIIKPNKDFSQIFGTMMYVANRDIIRQIVNNHFNLNDMVTNALIDKLKVPKDTYILFGKLFEYLKSMFRSLSRSDDCKHERLLFVWSAFYLTQSLLFKFMDNQSISLIPYDLNHEFKSNQIFNIMRNNYERL